MKFYRWLIYGLVGLFFLKTALQHWQHLPPMGSISWTLVVAATGMTLLAHLWAGVVWCGIWHFLGIPHPGPLVAQVLPVYLKTNLAKYLPGSVWHYYGRLRAVVRSGGDLPTGLLSVLLEPLLMAGVALSVALFGTGLGWLAAVLGALTVHPWVMNRSLQFFAKFKRLGEEPLPEVKGYPWWLLAGELGFLLLRFGGFSLALRAITTVGLGQVPMLLTGFSWAWLLGLLVPTPGGLGMFEASAITLLQPQFSPGILLASVVVYRLMNIAAEAIGAIIGLSLQHHQK